MNGLRIAESCIGGSPIFSTVASEKSTAITSCSGPRPTALNPEYDRYGGNGRKAVAVLIRNPSFEWDVAKPTSYSLRAFVPPPPPCWAPQAGDFKRG